MTHIPLFGLESISTTMPKKGKNDSFKEWLHYLCPRPSSCTHQRIQRRKEETKKTKKTREERNQTSVAMKFEAHLCMLNEWQDRIWVVRREIVVLFPASHNRGQSLEVEQIQWVFINWSFAILPPSAVPHIREGMRLNTRGQDKIDNQNRNQKRVDDGDNITPTGRQRRFCKGKGSELAIRLQRSKIGPLCRL